MGEVVTLSTTTTLPIPLKRVLVGALHAKLDKCLLLGVNGDGFYIAATHQDIGEHLILLEKARRALMEQVDGS